MDMRYNDSIDDKNIALLDELERSGVQIEFEIKEELGNWGVQERLKFAIAAPNNLKNSELFAHELLHIKLNILGFLTTPVITSIFRPHNCHFDTGQFSNIQNQLAHLRMLPLFLELGYDANKFVANHGDIFLVEELLPSTGRLTALFGLFREIVSKPSIDMVTEFIVNILCLHQYENYYRLTGEKGVDIEALKEMLRNADENLLNVIYTQVSEWTRSGTFSNYDFYHNLNCELYNLGFPIQSNWAEWQLINDKG